MKLWEQQRAWGSALCVLCQNCGWNGGAKKIPCESFLIINSLRENAIGHLNNVKKQKQTVWVNRNLNGMRGWPRT